MGSDVENKWRITVHSLHRKRQRRTLSEIIFQVIGAFTAQPTLHSDSLLCKCVLENEELI